MVKKEAVPATQSKELKTKEERVKEGINILIKLRETGVDETDVSFVELKGVVREWINNGEYWSGRVEFPAYDKYVEGFLPRYKGQAPVMAFKVKKQ